MEVSGKQNDKKMIDKKENDKKENDKKEIKNASEKKEKSKNKMGKWEEIEKNYKNIIDKLKEELTAKEKEAKENYDKLLRLNAEYDNFKKRMQREKADYIKFAGEKFVRDILPIVDDLERAIKSANEKFKAEDLIKGVEMVTNQLKSSLDLNGVIPFESTGQYFDPNKHEAVSKIATTEYEHNIVMEELCKGWMFHDRLIRAAMVVVAENLSEEKAEKNDKTDSETGEEAKTKKEKEELENV